RRGTPEGRALARIATEIMEDRAALLEMMYALEVPVDRLKTALGWALEKAGRFKLNGSLFERSALSDLIELETLQLGVEAKLAGWRVLLTRAQADGRLDELRLEGLQSR